MRRLLRIEEDAAFVGLVADEAAADADARAERQAIEYVAGVTRWRRWLDFLIAHFYRGPFDRMELPLRQVLRIGLYDLLFLHTPSHAAVHEAVELARTAVRPAAAGLVNGILRSVQRRQDRLPHPQTGDAAQDLAIRHSHPTWMVRRWLARFGPVDTEALLRWNNTRPIYGLRPNPHALSIEALHRQLDELGVAWEPSAYLDDFARVRKLQPVVRAGWLRAGRCAVQDESGGLVVRVLDPQPGETLVDGCAAPGGKALYAATRMQGQGRLLACDVHAGRLRLVQQAAQVHQVTIIAAEAVDLRQLAKRPSRPEADRVLLDVPCSGLGVLAKRADLRWNRTLEEIAALTTLQDQLLDAAARLVRPGGLLVYSTCTTEPEENEERVAAFLTRHPAFAAEPARGLVPERLLTAEGALATLPHRDHIDGAFAARLRRTS